MRSTVVYNNFNQRLKFRCAKSWLPPEDGRQKIDILYEDCLDKLEILYEDCLDKLEILYEDCTKHNREVMIYIYVYII